MDTKEYIDRLFEKYEKNEALTDFKEELQSNMDERVRRLVSSGMGEEEAFAKAAKELGDISAVADEISLKKKKDVYSEMYMSSRQYLTIGRITLFVLFGILLAAGAIILTVSIIAMSPYAGSSTATLGTLFSAMGYVAIAITLFALPIGGLVFMGLIQETSMHEPMRWRRAFFYALATFIILSGISLSGISVLCGTASLAVAIMEFAPFLLVSVGCYVVLGLTEKDRKKPWVREQSRKIEDQVRENIEKSLENYGADHKSWAVFGIVSGALWIAAIALFVVLSIWVGFAWSWVALPLAIIVQLILLAAQFKKLG